MNFAEVVKECISNKEFISQYDRLKGSNLQRKGSPVDLAIDDSSGRYESELFEFFDFVVEYVWDPLLRAEQ